MTYLKYLRIMKYLWKYDIWQYVICIVLLLVLKNSSHPTIRTTSSCECSSVVLLSWCGSPPRELFLAYKARSARGATLTFESVAFEPPRAQELRPGKYQQSRNYSLTHYSFRVITQKNFLNYLIGVSLLSCGIYKGRNWIGLTAIQKKFFAWVLILQFKPI